MSETLNFAALSEHWQSLPFEPFRDGVDIHTLWSGWPRVAILRYAPGARIPRHRHAGLETIFVLDGSQSDERGRYSEGSFVVNPTGSVHSVWSEEGCAVLIQWEKPVEFLD